MDPQPRKRSLSGIEHIRPNRDFARNVIMMGAGGLLTLLVLAFAGVFDRDEGPKVEGAAMGLEAPKPKKEEPKAPEPKAAEPAKPVVTEAKIPEPPPTSGILVLSTYPACEVFNGTERVGKTPVRLELEQGRHELRLVNRRKLIDTKRKFTVTAGQRNKKRVSFPLATLKVQAPDGAKLWIDGKPFGKTSARPMEVLAGTHTLLIKYKGEKIRQRVEMPKDRTYEYKVDYKPGGPIDD